MNYNNWQKGSQWRKWDLHVHTPASFHWKGHKLLSEMSSEEKDATFKELLETIEKSDVAVFCFMDYWTFDGYIQFRNYLKQNNLVCTKAFFPGMELRIEAPVDFRLNIHIIASDSLSDQQLDDFKSQLMVRSIDRRISNEAIIEFANSLDASKAKFHGFNDPKSLSPKELLKLGSSTIEITKESLRNAINTLTPGMAYIILPYDTSDGLAKLNWKTHPHADNYFMQSAHIIESRDDETVELFLNIETTKNRGFIENFQKTLNGVQKPVICGSDAHSYANYGKFPSNKATWIKANPTFTGFKQIIYEPRERVLLQELQPNEKIPYRVIDKIRFIDKTSQKLFSSEWIDLNENLNAIIGGKSSGKSLLLYHIAKTIAPNLLENRSKEVTLLNYSFGTLDQFDFEVLWNDGRCDKLSEPSENTREIEYIPQLYVNVLAEKQGKTSLYKLIESILGQNVEYREFIQDVQKKISELEILIDNKVSELLGKRDELQILFDQRKTIGELQAINNEITRLSLEISELRRASDFTDAETLDYKKLMYKQSEERQRKKKFDEVGNAISSLNLSLEQIKKHAIQTLGTTSEIGLDRFSRRVLFILKSIINHTISNSLNQIISSQKILVYLAQEKSAKCDKNQLTILEKLKPYTAKFQDKTKLQSLEIKLKEQEGFLEAYNKKTAYIEDVKQIGIQTRKELSEHYTNLLECYKKIIEKLITDKYSQIDADIVLEASIRFDVEKFSASFEDLFNRRRTIFKTVFGSVFNDNNEFQFEENSHVQNMFKIYEKLASKPVADTITFRQGIVAADTISQLFKNYFKIEYNIRYRDDEILDMSPGKRGLVLLQLILHISNSTHPILIDQPEDNLDNRTISNELKQFIATKKQTRQIIMVTHDANLVVLTDAENIIVSNQDGQQINRENAKYRFEYVAGALENSFRIPNQESTGVLFSCGIREHVCDVLEGGEIAFKKREEKYGFSNR